MMFNQETKVGLFLLGALAIILPSILFIGNIKLFKRSIPLAIDFKDVEALPPKAAVKIAGVEVGKVSDIELIKGRARVKINIDPEIRVYENAVARIGSTGIIGSRFVELDPGSPAAPPLEPGAVIKGLDGASLNDMISKISGLFEEDEKGGNAVDNLKATLANLRRMTDALAGGIGGKKQEISDIVLNFRDATENLKGLMRDLNDIVGNRKEDVKVALANFRSISEKLDRIMTKIEDGEGTIGTLVSDEKTAEDVKEAIVGIKDTAQSAKEFLGRITAVQAYWNYRFRYDTRDSEGRSDLSVKFIPRPGKFYMVGAENLGNPIQNEKNLEFERKNRITAVLGMDYGPFTGYAGVIRSDGGLGADFRPLWFVPKWKDRLSLGVQAADFNRDRVVQGRRLDNTWMSASARLAIRRWLWIGARVDDILGRSAFMTQVNVIFRDEDLAYILGLASLAR